MFSCLGWACVSVGVAVGWLVCLPGGGGGGGLLGAPGVEAEADAGETA